MESTRQECSSLTVILVILNHAVIRGSIFSLIMGGYQAEISYYYAFMLTAYVLRGVSLCVGDVALSGLFIRAKVFETLGQF